MDAVSNGSRRFTAVLLAAFLVTVLALVAGGRGEAAAAEPGKALTLPGALPRADESGLVPINDIQMWYAIFNKKGGAPVLLIHGGLGSGDNWGNQIPALAKTHQVIIADSRGHGRSTRSARPFSFDVMTDDYVALLKHLHVDKVALVGQSDGAIIGLDMAMRYPERLGKLWAFGANFNHAGLRTDAPNPFQHRILGPALKKRRQDYEKLSPTPTEYESLFNAMNAMWETQPDFKPEQLARIRVPTVIADGENEELIRRDHTEALARLVPGATLVILPGVGHVAMWQDPQLYNQALLRFLDTVSK